MYLQHLVQLAAWLVGRRPPPSGRSPLDTLLRGWHPPSEPPSDPFARVREPHRRKPGGRSSAVALLEPEPPQLVTATGRRWRQNHNAASDLLETLGNYAKGQRLDTSNGLVSVLTVGHDARQRRHFGQPTAVVFSLDFDRERHANDVPRLAVGGRWCDAPSPQASEEPMTPDGSEPRRP
jgi:hypothetical protein